MKTGEYLAGLVAESLVEKDKKLKISEFAEKCKTFITDRFYRDLLVPKEFFIEKSILYLFKFFFFFFFYLRLRMSVRREYNNQDGVDRVKDERIKKEKEEKERKEKEEKAKKE